MSSEKVVVAGAGFAGLSSALKLARKGYEVELVDKRSHHEYTPGIINLLRHRLSEKRFKLELKGFLEETPVKFSKQKIIGIDPGEKLVETDKESHSYDYLVLSLGSEPRTFGMDLSNCLGCYCLEDAKKIGDEVEKGDNAVIIGSGYVGVETAGELKEKGVDVTVVDASTRPMPNSGQKTSQLGLEFLNNNGIAFKGGKRVIAISEDSLEFEDGEEIQTDYKIWAGGLQASEIVRDTFDTDGSGLKVNSGLSTENYDSIFAAGDCADTDSLKTAHNAMKQADIISANVDRGEKEPLKDYEPETDPLVISLGKTGIFQYGEFAVKNRLIRYFKDLVRIRYWFVMRKLRYFSMF